MTDLVAVLVKRVVNIQHCTARIAEHGIHALLHEHVDSVPIQKKTFISLQSERDKGQITLCGTTLIAFLAKSRSCLPISKLSKITGTTVRSYTATKSLQADARGGDSSVTVTDFHLPSAFFKRSTGLLIPFIAFI